jgi:hypothetical protein
MITIQQQAGIIGYMIQEGIDLQYGKVSLCDLTNYKYSEVRHNRRFQVHSEHPKHPWSMIYDELGPACMKFLELKKKVGKRH